MKKMIFALVLGLIVAGSFVGTTQNDGKTAVDIVSISDPGGGSGGSGS